MKCCVISSAEFSTEVIKIITFLNSSFLSNNMIDKYLDDLARDLGNRYEIKKLEKGKFIEGDYNKIEAVALSKSVDSDFLKKGPDRSCVFSEENSFSAISHKYKHNDNFYQLRDITEMEQMTEYEKMIQPRTSGKSCKYFQFENISGYLIGDQSDILVHELTPTINFSTLSKNTPTKLRNTLADLTAKSFSELHNLGITYYQTVPSNLGYNFDNKITFNPHPLISFKNNSLDRDRDIALLLRTNNWIPEKDKFLDNYFKELTEIRDVDFHKNNIYESLDEVEYLRADGDISNLWF